MARLVGIDQIPKAATVQFDVRKLPASLRLTAELEDARVLSGFMRPSAFQGFRDVHRPELQRAQRSALEARYRESRTFAASMPELDLSKAVLGGLEDQRVDDIKGLTVFGNAFGKLSTTFAWIDPGLVVPIQVYVKVGARPDPDSSDLFSVAFPPPAKPEFELSAGPTPGIYFVVSSSPHIYAGPPGVAVSPDGELTVTAATHVNFVQVMTFGDATYVKNGMHRLSWAVRAGIPRLPALVIRANKPSDAAIQLGADGFDFRELTRLRRPPLMRDFANEASMAMQLHGDRFGWQLSAR
jgi:hypothetical protein